MLRVVGRGIRPGLHFSFQKHDFGPCFITPAGGYSRNSDSNGILTWSMGRR